MWFNPYCYYLDPLGSPAFVPLFITEKNLKKTSDVINLPLAFITDWKRAGFLPTTSQWVGFKCDRSDFRPIAETSR